MLFAVLVCREAKMANGEDGRFSGPSLPRSDNALHHEPCQATRDRKGDRQSWPRGEQPHRAHFTLSQDCGRILHRRVCQAIVHLPHYKGDGT